MVFMNELHSSDPRKAQVISMAREAARRRTAPAQWRSGHAEGEGEYEYTPPAARMRLVIVDDQSTGRRILREMLQDVGQG